MAETIKIQRGHTEQLERGERETGRETVRTMDEAASTTDDLGSVDPDPPGAEPLVDSSPATAAAGGGGGVEVVSAPIMKRLGCDRSRHSGTRSIHGLRHVSVV